MRRHLALSAGVLLVMSAACGGSDGTNLTLDGGDTTDGGGGGDSGTTTDGGGIGDSGTTTDGGGGDSGTTTDAGAFDPANIPNLVLWLDAAKGVTQSNAAVSGWADQTSYKNDASQALGPRQPAFIASAVNNLPAVEFKSNGGQGTTGNMLNIADAQSLQWGHNDFLVAVVAAFKDNPQGGFFNGVGCLYAKVPGGGSNTTAGVSLFGNVPGGINQLPKAGLFLGVDLQTNVQKLSQYNDGNFRVYIGHRTGNTLELVVDGASVATQTQNSAIDVSAVNNGAHIGALGDASNTKLDGQIAEVMAVKGSISGSDLTGLETYLKTKYGL